MQKRTFFVFVIRNRCFFSLSNFRGDSFKKKKTTKTSIETSRQSESWGFWRITLKVNELKKKHDARWRLEIELFSSTWRLFKKTIGKEFQWDSLRKKWKRVFLELFFFFLPLSFFWKNEPLRNDFQRRLKMRHQTYQEYAWNQSKETSNW